MKNISLLCLALGFFAAQQAIAQETLRYGVESQYPPFESRNAQGELEGSISISAKPSARRAISAAAGWKAASTR